jgi:hypothetical protein
MEKTTAIEWLIKQWPILESQVPSYILEQAKEMEKEQIIEAHGNKKKTARDTGNYEYTYTGEMYFNDNYY